MKKQREFYDSTFYTRGGYFTWVLAGVTVVTAVGGGIMANQQAKKAQGQAGAQFKEQQEMLKNSPKFNMPVLPELVQANWGDINKQAILEDALAYQRSDKDFAKRHGGTVASEKLFEDQVLKDWKGEHEFMPQMQNELMRAGIANTLASQGTTGAGSVLAAGGAGEANIARQLGLGTMAFQDRNRANRMASLNMAEEIFPRRNFGMTGADYAQNAFANVENQNAWNAANYERAFEAEKARIGQAQNQQNAMMTSQNEMAKANAAATAERDKAVMGAAQSAIGGLYQGYAGSRAGRTTAGAPPVGMSATNYAAARTPGTWQANASGYRTV